MPDSTLQDQLDSGLERLGLSLPAPVREKLIAYLHLLERWNRIYNLTAVRDIQQMVNRHLLDSLSVLPLLQGSRLIDVGSGGGLPGIPLAMARPETGWVLLDSSAKKSRFLIQAVAELELHNVQVMRSRVESYRPAELFDMVVTRAFAGLAQILECTQHLLAEEGYFLALKGKNVQREMEDLPAGFVIRQLRLLEVPDAEGERYAVVIQREIKPAAR